MGTELCDLPDWTFWTLTPGAVYHSHSRRSSKFWSVFPEGEGSSQYFYLGVAGCGSCSVVEGHGQILKNQQCKHEGLMYVLSLFLLSDSK